MNAIIYNKTLFSSTYVKKIFLTLVFIEMKNRNRIYIWPGSFHEEQATSNQWPGCAVGVWCWRCGGLQSQ